MFGCACYPYLRPYNRHKIQFRSQLCVFTGYSPIHKGYLCLAQNGKTYISRHVIFDEHLFPFQVNSNFLSQSTHTSCSNAATPSTLPSIPVLPCTNRFMPLSIDAAPDPPTPLVTDHTEPAEHVTEIQEPRELQESQPTVTVSQDTASCSPMPAATINAHPMQTRGKSGIHKPKAMLVAHANSELHTEPK